MIAAPRQCEERLLRGAYKFSLAECFVHTVAGHISRAISVARCKLFSQLWIGPDREGLTLAARQRLPQSALDRIGTILISATLSSNASN